MDKRLIITIPFYNNHEGLLKSIKSINESFKIDIIIADDGSETKIDEKLIRSVFKNEGNIYFEYLDTNYGVGIAANKCLEFVKNHNYDYVARLDAGDICYKDKFSKQIDFLEKNKQNLSKRNLDKNGQNYSWNNWRWSTWQYASNSCKKIKN